MTRFGIDSDLKLYLVLGVGVLWSVVSTWLRWRMARALVKDGLESSLFDALGATRWLKSSGEHETLFGLFIGPQLDLELSEYDVK